MNRVMPRPDYLPPGGVPGHAAEPRAGRPSGAAWRPLLNDLATFGSLRTETGNAAVSLGVTGQVWYAVVQGDAVWLRGAGIALAGLADRWGGMRRPEAAPDMRCECVDLVGGGGDCFVRLSVMEGFGNAKRVLAAAPGGQENMPTRPLGDGPDGGIAQSLSRLSRVARFRFPGALDDVWFDADRAESAGAEFAPATLEPFFASLLPHGCPLAVLVGNRGVLQQHDGVFRHLSIDGDCIVLRGDEHARLRIDTRAVAQARLVGGRALMRGQSVRLYDDRGHCLASVGLAGTADHLHEKVWRSQVRLLML